MNREPSTVSTLRLRLTVGGLAALAIALAGCEPDKPPTTTVEPVRTPEEKLATILSMVREGVGDTSSGDRRVRAVVPGGMQPQWTTRVTEELQEPRTPGDLYRATVRIVTEGSLMVRIRPKPDDEPSDRKSRNPRRMPDSGLQELRYSDPEGGRGTADDIGLDSYDPVGAASAEAARLRESAPHTPSIKTVDSRSEKVFVLVYENDRWNMLTEFEEDSPDMELYMRSFQRALRLQ
ncbi:hypothetical protein Pla175_47690 [Pirellulimonas nuda]|uniref:Lipoprotein n=1 Tax=Pirellulimonas nuda TaxID=2528009 RepID=A0A518DIP9_9BACT|nr:hypothetical protein [Pirellulimonas nuda]QDU91348.1 hypothetical protein Pla175_47690 [Pirellulimonas nuda]